MRSILVLADSSPSMDPRLETALSLARVNSGHVTVLVDTPISRYVSMDPMGVSYVASDAMEAAVADDNAHGKAIDAQLARQDVVFNIMRSEADPLDALVSASRLADVTILSRSNALAGELALAIHTPVLVLPDAGELRFPLGSAAIAWDGGREAADALRAAVPLLAGCPSVHVLTIKDHPAEFPGTDAVRYLSRHGLCAEVTEIKRERSTEETIARAVAELHSDVLVMGAYSKGRMREYLFGGVTRYFLEETARPALFLAH